MEMESKWVVLAVLELARAVLTQALIDTGHRYKDPSASSVQDYLVTNPNCSVGAVVFDPDDVALFEVVIFGSSIVV